MKFNQLEDDAAENFAVAQAVVFAELAKPAQLQAQFSQLQSQYINYFNKLFINGKKFTFRRLDGRDLNNGNNSFKRFPHRNLWIPLIRINRCSHIMDCIF